MYGLPGNAASADLQRSAEWRKGHGLRVVLASLLLQSRERSEAGAGSRDGYGEKTRAPQGRCAAGMVLSSGLRRRGGSAAGVHQEQWQFDAAHLRNAHW